MSTMSIKMVEANMSDTTIEEGVGPSGGVSLLYVTMELLISGSSWPL